MPSAPIPPQDPFIGSRPAITPTGRADTISAYAKIVRTKFTLPLPPLQAPLATES